jgi:hypothetical protein
MTFVISTDEIDRHGDVIVADGWKLDSYRKNPVFFWAHDYARPVIGKAVDIWVEPHSFMAKIQFAPTEFAQEVAALYETGYQRGVSVGFKPLSYEERRHEKTGAFWASGSWSKNYWKPERCRSQPTATPWAGPWNKLHRCAGLKST